MQTEHDLVGFVFFLILEEEVKVRFISKKVYKLVSSLRVSPWSTEARDGGMMMMMMMIRRRRRRRKRGRRGFS